jgi:hypothetical protein
MFPPKNVSKIIFFSFKIPGKIPKINFSEFENLAIKNSKLQGFSSSYNYPRENENFQFFLVLKYSRQKVIRKFF